MNSSSSASSDGISNSNDSSTLINVSNLNDTANFSDVSNSSDLVKLTDRVKKYIIMSKSPNTVRGYESDWADFCEWCNRYKLLPMPAAEDTVILYISSLAEAGMKMSTIARRISSISIAHQAKDRPSPTHGLKVRAVWKGIRHEHGSREVGKAPLLTEDLRRMVENLPINIRGLRDKALLLVGFAGAFRRSELVALNVENLVFTTDGIAVTIERSKTDPLGLGRKLGIAYGIHEETCPVRALASWLKEASITTGPLFRKISKSGRIQDHRLCDKSVALIVKKAATAAGLDPKIYSGHSLRAGFATSAAIAGISERSIMKQTGHKSTMMVRRYIRDGNLFRDNASSRIGL